MRKQVYMKLGFPELLDVSSFNSIEDLSLKKQMGIYLLKFPDGDYYVGKTRNVVRRFREHRRNFGKISSFSFIPEQQTRLNEKEQYCIGALEGKCQLRNISLVSSPGCKSDLDSIIPPRKQEQWVSKFHQEPTVWTRTCDDILRKRYEQKFLKLKSDEMFMCLSLPVMQKYVKFCIPEPCLTETSFWGCSCLPNHNNPEVKVYSRINIYWQEVFYVGFDLVRKEPFYGFFVTKSKMKNEIQRLKREYPTLAVRNERHLPGGEDQHLYCVYALQDALRMLDDSAFVYAVKTFNLCNMRKGASVYSRYHCMSLADYLLK